MSCTLVFVRIRVCKHRWVDIAQGKHANGLIKLVDVAPEEPGNLDFIKECHNEVRI